MSAPKQMTKLHVLAAVEPTSGMSPADALTFAQRHSEKQTTRIVILNYLPAWEVLLGKGFTQEEAAKLLVEAGAPFTVDSMIVRFREARRERSRK